MGEAPARPGGPQQQIAAAKSAIKSKCAVRSVCSTASGWAQAQVFGQSGTPSK